LFVFAIFFRELSIAAAVYIPLSDVVVVVVVMAVVVVVVEVVVVKLCKKCNY